MEKLIDRAAAWILRSVATAMLFAGLSALVAAVPLFGMLPDYPLARAAAGILFQISALFVIGGATAMYLTRPGRFLLPNERPSTADAEPADLGGWLFALVAALIALPVLAVLRLQPFLAEWARVADLLASPDLWQGANANGSGLVLVPLAAALTPPLLELAALSAFVFASVALLVLLVSRSRRFPRHYLVCGVLLSALVMASARGADAAMLAADGVQRLIESSNPRPGEDAQLREWLDRYSNAVRTAVPVLVWTLGGYLIWVPAIIRSRRARTTFARRAEACASAGTATDIETITAPPQLRG